MSTPFDAIDLEAGGAGYPQASRRISTERTRADDQVMAEAGHSGIDRLHDSHDLEIPSTKETYDGQDVEQGHVPETFPSPEEEARHQAGFSAAEFVKYEKRIRESISEHGDGATSSATSESSSKRNSLAEDDIVIRSVVATPTVPDRVHSRVESTNSINTYATADTAHLPRKRQAKMVRQVRHKGLNVYRRLFTGVFAANAIALLVLMVTIRHRSSGQFPLSDVATAAAANILVAILIRQDYVVNFLFRTCWLTPHSMPLWFRTRIAKIYEHGGIHSGAGVSGTMWFILLTVMLTIDFVEGTLRNIPILTVAYVLLTLFILILLFAYPGFRFMSHNTFEITHRLAGWAAVGLFWVEILLLGHEMSTSSAHSLGHVLIHLPSFWILIVVTFHIILPWLRLRRWTFTPEILSSHAVRINFPKTLPPLSGLAISDSPLREWHPFATFPNKNGGGAMIISKAGDWTAKTIAAPKTHYWVKGLPKTGVLSMAFVFRRVVIVTTGSGIGPCLSFLREPRARRTQCRLLWSTPSPLATYGLDIYDSVLKADSKAVVIDTRQAGRPDMVAITYALYVESGAEAVFVISNPRLTRKVVYAMESRGVPAFGPVWDS